MKNSRELESKLGSRDYGAVSQKMSLEAGDNRLLVSGEGAIASLPRSSDANHIQVPLVAFFNANAFDGPKKIAKAFEDEDIHVTVQVSVPKLCVKPHIRDAAKDPQLKGAWYTHRETDNRGANVILDTFEFGEEDEDRISRTIVPIWTYVSPTHDEYQLMANVGGILCQNGGAPLGLFYNGEYKRSFDTLEEFKEFCEGGLRDK